MSVRAYRVNKIDHEKRGTFNLWRDEKLVEYFSEECGIYDTLNEGSGMTEILVVVLEKALEAFQDSEIDKKALQKDIDWAKKNGEEYVRYYCF